VRISVLGALRSGARASRRLHYGIDDDDEVVVLVAPSTARRAEYGGSVLGRSGNCPGSLSPLSLVEEIN
jgi:hypothetical protein